MNTKTVRLSLLAGLLCVSLAAPLTSGAEVQLANERIEILAPGESQTSEQGLDGHGEDCDPQTYLAIPDRPGATICVKTNVGSQVWHQVRFENAIAVDYEIYGCYQDYFGFGQCKYLTGGNVAEGQWMSHSACQSYTKWVDVYTLVKHGRSYSGGQEPWHIDDYEHRHWLDSGTSC